MEKQVQIAVLDDYQQVALQMADWSIIQTQAKVTVFSNHLKAEAEVIQRLLPFEVVCVMRERTPLTRNILAALPNLKLIVSTGRRNASIDVEACNELGIELRHTGYVETGAMEMTWALLLAIARKIVPENNSVRLGSTTWQSSIGTDVSGKTLGIVGLGRIGSRIARYAKAFDMDVIAWSQNLTAEKAAEYGARLVSKDDVFREADFVTIHLVLSGRTRGIVDAQSLALMKKTAYLINTSRGPLVDEAALIDVLLNKRITGAALDVFNEEPLPEDHIFRQLDNVLITPHIGYVTEETYKVFYRDTVTAIADWLKIK